MDISLSVAMMLSQSMKESGFSPQSTDGTMPCLVLDCKVIIKLWPCQNVLLPVLPMQEILPWKFALSKGCCIFKKRYVNAGHTRLFRLLRDFLYHHLTHKGNRNTPHAVYHFVGAGDIGAG